MDTEVSAQQQLLRIGQLLKDKRESLNLSLKDIAEKTCISSSVLKAIESGDMDNLPVYVYLRGFILTYAREVGLKEKSVLQDIQTLLSQQSEAAIKPTGRTSELENMVETELHLMPVIAASVILLLLAGVIVFFNTLHSCDLKKSFVQPFKSKNLPNEASKAKVVDESISRENIPTNKDSTKQKTLENKPAKTETISSKPEDTQSVIVTPAPTNLEIVVKALGKVKIFYQIDKNKETKTLQLETNHFDVLKAKETLFIQTDTSELVHIFQNGEDLGLLGKGEKAVKFFKDKKPEIQ